MSQPLPSAVDELNLLPWVAASIDDGIVITNADGLTTWVNPGFSRLCGYDPAELLGKKPGAVLQGAQTDAEAVQRLRTALQARQPCSVDLLNYHKDGHPYWVAIHITPLIDSAGQLARFVAIERDITDSKVAEQEQQEQLNGLAQTLAQIRRLPNLLTSCAWCRRVRDEQDQWYPLDTYLAKHMKVTFTHGICATCRAQWEDS
jgi:PAS domain S-box-containing protein